MDSIIVLHEYGARSHYLGLEELAKSKGYQIDYYEFSIFRHFVKSIYRKDTNLFYKTIDNFLFILKALFSGLDGKRVVVGIAPYDYRIILINILVRKSKYYLHTSWPQWFGGFTPKLEIKALRNAWRKFMINSSGIFTVTNAVKDNILSGMKFLNEDKISVVYHSIDKKFSNFSNNFTPIQPKKTLKALYVGRYEDGKGIDRIFELARLHPTVEFYFIGSGPIKIPTLENISDLGRINNKTVLAEFMATCDFLLLPSVPTRKWQEAFGLVVVEALSCGVYPIVSNNIGPKELVGISEGSIFDIDTYIEEVGCLFSTYRTKDIEERIAVKNNCIESAKMFHTSSISLRWIQVFR